MIIRRNNLRSQSAKKKEISIKNKKIAKDSKISNKLLKATIDSLTNAVNESVKKIVSAPITTRRCTDRFQKLKNRLSISQPIDDLHFSSLTPNKGGIKKSELQLHSHSSLSKANITSKVEDHDTHRTRKISGTRNSRRKFTSQKKFLTESINPRRSSLRNISAETKETTIKNKSTSKKNVKESNISSKSQKAINDDLQNVVNKSILTASVSSTSSRRSTVRIQKLKNQGLLSISQPIDDLRFSSLTPNKGGIKMSDFQPHSHSKKNITTKVKELSTRERKSESTTPEKFLKNAMNPRRSSLRSHSEKIKDTPIKNNSSASIVKGSKISNKLPKATVDDLRNSVKRSVKAVNAPNKSLRSSTVFKTKKLELSSSSQPIDDLHCFLLTPNKGGIQESTKLVHNVSSPPNLPKVNIRSKGREQRKCRTAGSSAGREKKQNKAPEKINRSLLSRSAKNKSPSQKSSDSTKIHITDNFNTRSIKEKQNLEPAKKNNTRNKVVKGVHSKLLKKNHLKLLGENVDSLVKDKTVQRSSRLSKKNLSKLLPPATPKPPIATFTDELYSDEVLPYASKQTFGRNADYSSNASSNENTKSNGSLNTARKTSKTGDKRKQVRRHTVPILKKNYKRKKVGTENVTRSTLHSPKLSQNSSPINHFSNLNNIPIDDLTLTSFSSPNSFNRNFGSKEGLMTSTPCQTQSTKGKKRKLSKNTLLNGSRVSKKPSRGTLKQKRWIINTLKERNEGYADDIFESNKFDGYKDVIQYNQNMKRDSLSGLTAAEPGVFDKMMEDYSDNSSISIETPKCAALIITPKPPLKTPRYKDCYSPMEWLKTRKLAEEVMHRRNQKRKSDTSSNATSSRDVDSTLDTSDNLPEKKRLEFMSLIQNIPKQKEDVEEDRSDEDDYFSDVST